MLGLKLGPEQNIVALPLPAQKRQGLIAVPWRHTRPTAALTDEPPGPRSPFTALPVGIFVKETSNISALIGENTGVTHTSILSHDDFAVIIGIEHREFGNVRLDVLVDIATNS